MIRVAMIVIGLLVLTSPVLSHADMVDVVTIKLHDGCSMADLTKLTDDLNAYGEQTGGVPDALLAPLHSRTQGVFIFVGRFPSVEAFGKSNDTFRAQAGMAGSDAAKLRQRAMECASIVDRASAVTVK